MKHRIENEKNIGSSHWLISIELIPENDEEKKAIEKNVNERTDSERQLLDGHLHFTLGETYSIADFVNQNKNFFTVKAFRN